MKKIREISSRTIICQGLTGHFFSHFVRELSEQTGIDEKEHIYSKRVEERSTGKNVILLPFAFNS